MSHFVFIAKRVLIGILTSVVVIAGWVGLGAAIEALIVAFSDHRWEWFVVGVAPFFVLCALALLFILGSIVLGEEPVSGGW